MLWTTQIIALFPLFSQGLNRTFQVVFLRVKPLTKTSVVWAWFGRGLGLTQRLSRPSEAKNMEDLINF